MPNKLNLNRFNFNKTKGFTVIELVLVVVILGIISSIALLSYSSWKQVTIANQLKNDLSNLSIAMEDYRNFSNKYPNSIPSSYQVSKDVNISLYSSDGENYCAEALSNNDNSLIYSISSSNDEPQDTSCALSSFVTTAPAAPTVAVALSAPNVVATASAVTCNFGTAQYGIRSRTNDGTWSAYSAWSTTRTASQAATDGVKYGYQAQARCYIDASNISATVTSSESTYTDPITTVPATLAVSNSSTSTTTTWSWTAPTTCPAGTSPRYQYRYTHSQGYDSGLIATSNTSVAFTTSTEGVTYIVAVQAQCYNANTSGSWNTAASSSYTRSAAAGGTITYNSGTGSWTAPAGTKSVTAYVWGAGGYGGGGCNNSGGGGGGAFAKKVISKVTAGKTYSYSVGSGGNYANGKGGDSWFVDSSTVIARGGNSDANSGGLGYGVGGQASACIPTTGAYSGGRGGYADTWDYYGGGGGGGAGSGGNGIDGSNGFGYYGVGGAGGIGTYPGGNGGTAPNPGVSPGGGGGGSDEIYNCEGGVGANGRVTLVW